MIKDTLRIKNLDVGYDGNVVVKNANLTLRSGQCIALVGESGSGKSTLAKSLVFLNEVFNGEIIYIDKDNKEVDINKLSNKGKKGMRKNIQMIIQDSKTSFPPNMTVFEYIEEPLINFYSLSKNERKEKINRLIESVGLNESYLNRYPTTLSGGERQRVSITRALAIEPRVLICDETTSALDVTVQKQIINLFIKLKNEYDIAFLFICHDIALMNSFCDEVNIMYKGEIVEKIQKDCFKDAKHEHTKNLIKSSFSL